MQVAGFYVHGETVICQIFGHALGQRCHKDALAFCYALAALSKQVFHLPFDRTYLDLGVQQACRTYDLLSYQALGLVQLVFSGRCRDIDDLSVAGCKLVKAQGAVVQGRRQSEAVVYQGLLAGSVSLVHAAKLRHRDMRFVDKEHVVFRKIVQETGRWLAFLSAVQMTRVVFNARAVAKLFQHFQVQLRPLFQALLLYQLVLGMQFL